jgi:hypothetical protein
MAKKVIYIHISTLAIPFIQVRKAPNLEDREGYILLGKNTEKLLIMYHMLWSNQSILSLQPALAFWLQVHLILGLWQFHR